MNTGNDALAILLADEPTGGLDRLAERCNAAVLGGGFGRRPAASRKDRALLPAFSAGRSWAPPHPQALCLRYAAMLPADKPNPLASGFHSRGVLPYLKREGGVALSMARVALLASLAPGASRDQS